MIINESDFDPEKHELYKEQKEPGLITKSYAEKMNRDELREYAKPFGITGTSKDGILEELIKAGKLLEGGVE